MIIGLEGVSCTGKTTLALELTDHLRNAQIVPCYYHAAPDPRVLYRREIHCEEDQLAVLATHLEVEGLRQRQASAAMDLGCCVILDRTVDTLLAHVRAVGALNGLDANQDARALVDDQIKRGRVAVPSVTLLLCADHELVAARASARIAMPTLYYDAGFTRAFQAHFAAPVAPVCLVINADAPVAEVAEKAYGLLRPYLDGE